MTKNAPDALRILATLDPAKAQENTPQQRTETLHRILAAPAPTAPHRPITRRRVILVGGAAATVAGAGAGLGWLLLDGGAAAPAYAATPRPLDYDLSSPTPPAPELLSRLAQAAARSGPVPGAGAYEHLRWQSWGLSTRVKGLQVTSAIIPQVRETWRGVNGSGRLVVESAPPEFPNEQYRRYWLRHGEPGAHSSPVVTEYRPGEFVAMWPDDPPQETEALRRWLAIGHPAENGPVETLLAITDLARERLLRPAVRACLLRILAEVPGIGYAGEATDRAGRRGYAFFLDSARAGLPTRYTLIVNAADGTFLNYEQMLTETAGKLDVPIPSVISYEVYLSANLASLPPR